MKHLAPLAIAALLACGAPLTHAAGPSADDNRDGKVSLSENARDKGRQAKGMAANAGKKFTRGVRRITHPNETAQATPADTRSMGAASSADNDSARRARMDDAYANWKRKNG